MLLILACFSQAGFLSFLIHVGGLVLFEGFMLKCISCEN